jgi:hypothetical protein
MSKPRRVFRLDGKKRSGMARSAMKYKALFLVLLLGLSVTPSEAALSDVQITATKLKLDEKQERKTNVTVKSKEIAYSVTVQSKSFKPIENLEIKYMVFYHDEKSGEKNEAGEKSFIGVEKIPMLEANRSVSFNTKPLVLTSEALDAGWYYANGAASQAKDRTTGVWFRAYANGQMIGEYANPASITSRTWKDQ